MPDVVQEIGALVGLAAFFGLALLTFLYFAQARHVRDLEEKATYVPEDLELPTEAATPPPPGDEDEEAAAAQQAPAATQQLQAARQVEMARASAERRARFEQRRRPGFGRRDGEDRRMPEPRAMAVIAAGVAVLAAGVVFGADRFLGGDDDGGSGGATSTVPGAQAPDDIEVAVLNSTPVPGLAAGFSQEVRQTFKLGRVGNTETPFEASVVMFDQGHDADAQAVAGTLGVTKTQPMSSEVKRASEGAPVAFIVGEDRASQNTGT